MKIKGFTIVDAASGELYDTSLVVGFFTTRRIRLMPHKESGQKIVPATLTIHKEKEKK